MARLIQVFGNNTASSLAATVGSAGVVITLKEGDGAKFPAAFPISGTTDGQYFMATLVGVDADHREVQWEVVKCTNRNNDVLTVQRAAEPINGTATAYQWGAGTTIELRATAGTLARLNDTASRPLLNVKDFGAVGDGTTNDTAAINGAIAFADANKGAVIYFPDGDYYITSGISINKPNILLQGSGRAKIIAYTTNNAISFSESSTVTMVGCGVRTLTIEPSSTVTLSSSTVAINFVGNSTTTTPQGFCVEGVLINNFYTGIQMSYATGFEIKNTEINNVTCRGILISTGCKNGVILGVRCKQPLTTTGTSARLKAWAAQTAFAKGDIVEAVTGSAFQCYTAGTSGTAAPALPSSSTPVKTFFETDMTDGTVVWRVLSRGTTSGISISSRNQLLIQNCELTGLYDGIYEVGSLPTGFASPAIVRVDSCKFTQCTRSGIYINASSGNTLMENSDINVTGGTKGIHVQASNALTVRGCNFTLPGQSGCLAPTGIIFNIATSPTTGATIEGCSFKSSTSTYYSDSIPTSIDVTMFNSGTSNSTIPFCVMGCYFGKALRGIYSSNTYVLAGNAYGFTFAGNVFDIANTAFEKISDPLTRAKNTMVVGNAGVDNRFNSNLNVYASGAEGGELTLYDKNNDGMFKIDIDANQNFRFWSVKNNTARVFLQVPIESDWYKSAAFPHGAEGAIGHFIRVSGGDACYMPAGGTWAYWGNQQVGHDMWGGIAAGGTNVGNLTSALCWRIA